MKSRQSLFKPKTFTPRTRRIRRIRRLPNRTRFLNRRLKPEIKSVDTEQVVSSIRAGSLSPTLTAVNVPVDGVAFYQRIGNEIAMKSIHFNGVIGLNASNAAVNNGEYVRIMIVYDRQTNNVAPMYTDIIRSYNPAGTQTSTSFDGLNQNNRKRFKILMDERVNLPGVGINGVTGINSVQETEMNSTRMNISRYIKLNGLNTTYSASAGDITDITSGGLYVFILGTTATANQVAYTCTWTTRLRYWDK